MTSPRQTQATRNRGARAENPSVGQRFIRGAYGAAAHGAEGSG